MSRVIRTFISGVFAISISLPPASAQQAQHGDRYENNLRSARQLAKQDPKIVAHVVKDWVAGNEQ